MPKPKTSTRLAGHGLPNEGRIDNHGTSNRRGRGRCECGATSPELRNTAQRKLWHGDHKASIRQGGDGVVWTGVQQ